jgi:hypothetical protein
MIIMVLHKLLRFTILIIPLLSINKWTRIFRYFKIYMYINKKQLISKIPRSHRCIRRVSLLSLEEGRVVQQLQALG